MRPKNPFKGISWLDEGRLGGCACPDTLSALDALQAAGTTLLITLTKEWKPDVLAINSRGISSLHVPIKDFTPPELKQALTVCEAIDSGQTVVLHCAAGKGRTGTLLAAYLIFKGARASDAVKKTRSVNPDWIETASQMDFLKRFLQPL